MRKVLFGSTPAWSRPLSPRARMAAEESANSFYALCLSQIHLARATSIKSGRDLALSPLVLAAQSAGWCADREDSGGRAFDSVLDPGRSYLKHLCSRPTSRARLRTCRPRFGRDLWAAAKLGGRSVRQVACARCDTVLPCCADVGRWARDLLSYIIGCVPKRPTLGCLKQGAIKSCARARACATTHLPIIAPGHLQSPSSRSVAIKFKARQLAIRWQGGIVEQVRQRRTYGGRARRLPGTLAAARPLRKRARRACASNGRRIYGHARAPGVMVSLCRRTQLPSSAAPATKDHSSRFYTRRGQHPTYVHGCALRRSLPNVQRRRAHCAAAQSRLEHSSHIGQMPRDVCLCTNR